MAVKKSKNSGQQYFDAREYGSSPNPLPPDMRLGDVSPLAYGMNTPPTTGANGLLGRLPSLPVHESLLSVFGDDIPRAVSPSGLSGTPASLSPEVALALASMMPDRPHGMVAHTLDGGPFRERMAGGVPIATGGVAISPEAARQAQADEWLARVPARAKAIAQAARSGITPPGMSGTDRGVLNEYMDLNPREDTVSAIRRSPPSDPTGLAPRMRALSNVPDSGFAWEADAPPLPTGTAEQYVNSLRHLLLNEGATPESQAAWPYHPAFNPGTNTYHGDTSGASVDKYGDAARARQRAMNAGVNPENIPAMPAYKGSVGKMKPEEKAILQERAGALRQQAHTAADMARSRMTAEAVAQNPRLMLSSMFGADGTRNPLLMSLLLGPQAGTMALNMGNQKRQAEAAASEAQNRNRLLDLQEKELGLKARELANNDPAKQMALIPQLEILRRIGKGEAVSPLEKFDVMHPPGAQDETERFLQRSKVIADEADHLASQGKKEEEVASSLVLRGVDPATARSAASQAIRRKNPPVQESDWEIDLGSGLEYLQRMLGE